MSDRLDTIKRLAETDPYWKGYLDGMRVRHLTDMAADTMHRADAVTQGAIATVADRSEYRTVEETRERLHAYYDASAAMGDDADPEDSRRWLQEARKRRSR